jgi:hypothetical protein
MALTPRTQIPYPDSNERDWDATFAAMVNTIDYSLFAAREDRNILILGGGTMTFTAATGVLTWGADIQLLSPISGYITTLAAGSATIPDNNYFYVQITRGPTSNITVTSKVGFTVQNNPSGDDQFLIGFRKGSIVHFREGFLIGDGQSKVVFDNTTSAGISNLNGDVTGPPATNTVVAIQGRPVLATGPALNDTLVWNGAQWGPGSVPTPNGVGDWTGAITSNTVGKINGATVPAAPGAGDGGKLFQVLGVAAYTFALLVNANVDVAAAIAGTKINPNFGSQNVVTTGSGTFASVTTTGDVLVGGNLTVNGTTTTVKSTVVDVEARIEHLNWAAIATVPVPTLPTGIEVERGDNGATKRDAAAVLWDETNQLWQFVFQTAANDTGLGAMLPIKALGATLTGLGGSGAGYATVSNTGVLGFATTVGSGAVAPGTNGQIFITNSTPASTWTSLISVDTVHGRFTSGGSGTDYKAIIGPKPAAETTRAALYLLPNAVVPGVSNSVAEVDGTYLYFNDVFGNGLFIYSLSSQLAGISTSGWSFNGGVAGINSAHGVATFGGGGGSDFKAVIGPLTGNSTSFASLHFLPAATAPGGNWVLSGGALDTLIGFPSGGTLHLSTPGIGDYVTLTSSQWSWLNGTTIASVEFAHGRATFGGGGTDFSAVIGPELVAPASGAALYLLPNATAVSAGNYTLYSNGSDLLINTISASGTIRLRFNGTDGVNVSGAAGTFTLSSGIPHIYWDSSTSAASIGTNKAGATLALQADAALPVLQFAGGLQAGTWSLGTNMAIFGHIRSPNSFVWAAQNNANTNAVPLMQWGTDSLAFGYSTVSTMSFTSSAQTMFHAGSYVQMACSTFYLATAAGLSTIQLTADATTSRIDFIQTTNATVGLAATTSNVANGNFKIQGQYAWNNVANTFNTPGSIIFDIGAPTNGSTTEAYFQFTRNGSTYAQIGTYPGSTSYGHLWLGTAAASSTNWALRSDASGSTYLNSEAGTAVGLITGGATFQLYIAGNIADFGGSGAASPVVIDWTTSTTPKIQGGTSATSLTVGTNKSGASLGLFADANVKGLALSQANSTTNQIDVYSPDGTSWATIQTVNTTGHISFTTANGSWDFISTAAQTEIQLNSTLSIWSNAFQWQNWSGTVHYLRGNASAGTVTIGDSTIATTIIGSLQLTVRTVSTGTFTFDTTTKDHTVKFTVTCAATLPTATVGRDLDLILDNTGGAGPMTVTLTRIASETINGVAANQAIVAQIGQVIGVKLRSIDGTNWYYFPG